MIASTNDFIERKLYIRSGRSLVESSIIITNPLLYKDDVFICNVKFSTVKKYDTTVKGIDQFHAIECALAYVTAICKNSDDPEFFINETESMKRFSENQ